MARFWWLRPGAKEAVEAAFASFRGRWLTREEMEASKHIHHVENYFDLFSHLAQPGAPSYTRVTVKKNQLLLETFKVLPNGKTELFNTIYLNK